MFVRGGFVFPGISLLECAGYEGDYWSSVGRYSASAYYLGFYSDSVDPSDSSSRYGGYFVRCVALGG